MITVSNGSHICDQNKYGATSQIIAIHQSLTHLPISSKQYKTYHLSQYQCCNMHGIEIETKITIIIWLQTVDYKKDIDFM